MLTRCVCADSCCACLHSQGPHARQIGLQQIGTGTIVHCQICLNRNAQCLASLIKTRRLLLTVLGL